MRSRATPFALVVLVLFQAASPSLAVEPAVYIPFDEAARAILSNGKAVEGTIHGKSIFSDAVVGTGLAIQRHAYDQVTAVNFPALPVRDLSAGAVAFWFRPTWDGHDGKRHYLVSMSCGRAFRLYLVKNDNNLFDYSVVAPQQHQILTPCQFKAERWYHLTLAWNLGRDTTAFYVDGRLVSSSGRSRGPFVVPDKIGAASLWFGSGGADRYKASTGDGVYDEFKLFGVALSDGDVQALVLDQPFDKQATRLDLSTAQAPSRIPGGRAQGWSASDIVLYGKSGAGSPTYLDPSAGACSFSLWFKLKQTRYSGPTSFLALDGDSRLTLAVTGPAGQVAAKLEQDGRHTTVLSKYSLDLGEMHHLAVQLTAAKRVELYIDGAPQASQPATRPGLGKITGLALSSAVSAASDMLATKGRWTRERLCAQLPEIVSAQATAVEKGLWRLDDACRERSRGRTRVCLNGLWRVQPAAGYSLSPPAGPWGLMRVPGSFRSALYEIYTEEHGQLKAQDWHWNKKPLVSFRAGWYQRQFRVPEEFNGKNVFLNFTNVVGDYGRIYVNGRLVDSFVSDSPCANAIPNRRRIDVTRLLRPENSVAVFVDRKWNLWRTVPSIRDHLEIALGDVWLECGPTDIQVASAVVFPSYRNKEATIRLRVKNPQRHRQAVAVKGHFARRGKGEKALEHQFTLNGEAEQVVHLKTKWDDPKLWDVEHPNLYTMALDLYDSDGTQLDSAEPVTFGFREFWVEDGEFYLNGKVTRLRMWSSPGIDRMRYYYGSPKGVTEYIAKLKEVGYNATRCNPIQSQASQVGWSDKFAESDRVGFYHLQPTPPYEGVVPMDDYRRHISRYVEAFGNHPSILMWYCDFNTCSYSWNQDPAKLNDTEYVPKHKARQRKLAGMAMEAIRSIDPSREVFHHAGGNFGKVFGSMNYQSMGVPLQEQEDWPKQWARQHTQPLMTVECDFPFWNQFLHFDLEPSRGPAKRLGKKSGLVYLVNEHAARYFGDDAFRQVQLPETDMALGGYRRWHSSMFSPQQVNFVRTKALLAARIVKAWRGYGVSGIGHFPHGRGQREIYQSFRNMNMVYEARNDVKNPGLKPDRLDSGLEIHRHALVDYAKPLPLLKSHQRAFAPLLVFLAGDPSDFTNKDHAFWSGERFAKSIVVVNDKTAPVQLTSVWSLTTDEEKTVLKRGESSRSFQAGEIAKLPIDLQAPVVYGRTACTLRLEVVHGGRVLAKDSLALQFFPRRPPVEPSHEGVVVFDPVGQTKAMLAKAGLRYTELLDVSDAAGKRLLIVGKHALSAEPPRVLRDVDAAGLIENGLKIVFFEQKQCHLGNLVFERPSQRIAFIRKLGHPIIEGLADDDFRNWRGGTDTVPAHVVSDEFSPHYPRDKWKCGNSGIVAGHVIRRPQYGNFSPILDCGFNLMNTPLLELRRGRGTVVFCQLDVTHRYGTDPVATQVVDNMLAHMGKPFVPLRNLDTFYVGGTKQREWLERAGADLRVAERLDDYYLRQAHVLICGAGSGPAIKAKRDDVVQFIKLGGGAFIMPGADVSWLPMGIKAEKRQVFRALLPDRPDPTLDNMPNADLYFRLPKEIPVITGGPQWAVKTDPAVIFKCDYGMGAVVVCTLDPERIDGLWNREKAARVLCKLLSNMHVGLGKGYQFFQGSTYRHNQLGRPAVGEPKQARDKASWSPYIDELDFYDVDAFHNW